MNGEFSEEEWNAIEPLISGSLSGLITDRDREISLIVYNAKKHLGSRGMIEAALVVSRVLSQLDKSRSDADETAENAE